MKRFDSIPLVQAGGHQPYAQAGGQMPGPALLAMLGGRTFGGFNPQDTMRAMQNTAGGQRPTLLNLLRG